MPQFYNLLDTAEIWFKPSYRTLPSGATIKIVHAHKLEAYREPRSAADFWVPKTIVLPDTQPSLAEVPRDTTRGSSGAIKRIRPITKREAVVIKQRRRDLEGERWVMAFLG